MKITDQDIEWAERLLLPKGCHFNDERRAFVQCMATRDVVACPGSGKTTALLAKLLILASKMPFPDGKGVCVLTHTNVAIDQIKSRAGVAASALFRHPNFFGTIQEFTNKFLAIPAYVARFGRRDIRMSEELYEEHVKAIFYEKSLYKNKFIYAQLMNQLKGLDQKEQLQKKISFFINLVFRFDGPLVNYVRGDTGKMILREDGKSSSYPDIHAAKYGLLEEGYLRYLDAFPLALWYLQTNPSLPNALSHRFKFIFIDEAQDTNADQLAVLNSAFSEGEDTIIQYLGDPNQAIYDVAVQEDNLWQPGSLPLHFSDTVRFGKTISGLLETVRIDNQISLKPNQNQNSFPPYLITFVEGGEKQVLPAFVQLLRTKNLDKLDKACKPIFKAIGWVGKDSNEKGKLCLRSYLMEYRKAIQRRRQHFPNLLSYLHLHSKTAKGTAGGKLYRDNILNGITHAFNISGKRHPETNRTFSPTTFLAWLQQDNEPSYLELMTFIAEWSLKLERREPSQILLWNEISGYIQNNFCEKATAEFVKFITSDELYFSEREQDACNVYQDGNIEVNIGTVHSVKGETHTATLYLETDYQKASDLIRLLPFLKGEYPEKERSKTFHIDNLKIAHVAMSRPTHLLAFACRKGNIQGHEKSLKENGWEICDVSDF